MGTDSEGPVNFEMDPQTPNKLKAELESIQNFLPPQAVFPCMNILKEEREER